MPGRPLLERGENRELERGWDPAWVDSGPVQEEPGEELRERMLGPVQRGYWDHLRPREDTVTGADQGGCLGLVGMDTGRG